MQPSDNPQPLNILEDELNKKRKKLLKALEQGEKVKNLTDSSEWQFYASWLQACKTEYQKQIGSSKFVNDHNGYLLTLGALQAIEVIERGTERFLQAYDGASKQNYELNKEFDKLKSDE